MIHLFTYLYENELQAFLVTNFNQYFNFSYVCQELTISCGRIDLIGEDEEHLYIIELKRDIVTQYTIEQLDNYISHYETTKNIIGIAAAPEICDNINLSLFKNNIRLQRIEGVKCLYDYTAEKLVNRTRLCSSVDKDLFEKIHKLSKDTDIPVSKLLDRAIKLLLEKEKKSRI